MKIRLADVFNNVNDIRQYMAVGMHDEVEQDLADNMGITTSDVDQILESAQIYFDEALINKFIKVPDMSDDMEELKSRLITMLLEDYGGTGEYSVGFKAALWELEHIDEPFVHGK